MAAIVVPGCLKVGFSFELTKVYSRLLLNSKIFALLLCVVFFSFSFLIFYVMVLLGRPKVVLAFNCVSKSSTNVNSADLYGELKNSKTEQEGTETPCLEH